MSYATREQFEELTEELEALEKGRGRKPLPERPREERKVKVPEPPAEEKAPPVKREKPAVAAVAEKPAEGDFSFFWIPSLILFGFGDTLTSYLVFAAGGRETNPVLAAMMLDGGMWGFVVLKTIILVALLALSYFALPKRQGWVIPSILTLVGTFLVAYNMVTLFVLI